MLHLNGILTGGAGTVTVGGLPVSRDRATLAEIRRRVGIVFQDPDDQLFLPTVAEDVAFGPANLGLRGAELAARVDEALAAVGMAEHRDRAPHHLSFGQRRRVAVATVLAMRPEILVLDEPSSNLDPAARRELAEILRGLPVTLLMVTHDLPYALELCDRSVILDEGRIVADGPTADPARRRRPAGRATGSSFPSASPSPPEPLISHVRRAHDRTLPRAPGSARGPRPAGPADTQPRGRAVKRRARPAWRGRPRGRRRACAARPRRRRPRRGR